MHPSQLLLFVGMASAAIHAPTARIDVSDEQFAQAVAHLCITDPSHSLCKRVEILWPSDRVDNANFARIGGKRKNRKSTTTTTTTTTTSATTTTPSSTTTSTTKAPTTTMTKKIVRSTVKAAKTVSSQPVKVSTTTGTSTRRQFFGPLAGVVTKRQSKLKFGAVRKVALREYPYTTTVVPTVWDWMNKAAEKEGYLFEDDEDVRKEIFMRRWVKAVKARKARAKARAARLLRHQNETSALVAGII